MNAVPAPFGACRPGDSPRLQASDNHRKVSLPAVPPDDPDAVLADRILAGDDAAIALLMARHGGRLRQLARRMTGRVDEAEDIVQEAFLAVWQRAAQFGTGRLPIGAYLTRTVVNRCIDRARRARIRRWIGLEAVPEVEDDAPSADEIVSGRSEVRAVIRDLAALPPRQRAAILLVSEGEHSLAQVAAAMSLSAGAAEQLLVRARRTLRAKALARLGARKDDER